MALDWLPIGSLLAAGDDVMHRRLGSVRELVDGTVEGLEEPLGVAGEPVVWIGRVAEKRVEREGDARVRRCCCGVRRRGGNGVLWWNGPPCSRARGMPMEAAVPRVSDATMVPVTGAKSKVRRYGASASIFTT